ncbi:MAG: metallophosphoesterase, partial [Candidatus Lokiarchaeota archaeon]|nr:metallophosphoesterase [Candidatus Lokiarchaeota archaeon]
MNANTNTTQSDKAILINPNLGHPLIINTDQKIGKTNFELEFLFISNITEIKKLEKFLKQKIQCIPIFEYRWKINTLIKEKKEKAIVKEGKKTLIWKKIKKLFSSKKKLKKQEETKQEETVQEKKQDFRRIKTRTYRGDPIEGIILSANEISLDKVVERENLEVLNPHEYLLKQGIFDGLNKFYRVVLDITLTEEVRAWLKEFTFIMFDIIQKRDNGEDRINNHALVVSKNDWKNINFVHATDLHLAERNDKIYEIVKNWLAMQDNIVEFAEKSIKKVPFFKKKSKQNIETKVQSLLIIEPLQKRLINPNNNFKKFIRLMNKKILQNELDFIVLTGDLIDFTILSRLPKDFKKLIDFDYEHSNWRIFKEIILDTPQKKRRGMIEGEELLCPIFTIPGNHDFRPYHYDIRWGNLYKKIGLNANEAIALNDQLVANPISSITRSFRALKGYFSEFNSSLDYSL